MAFELAVAVVEWHEAGTMEERMTRGVCALWKRPHEDDDVDMGLTASGEHQKDEPEDVSMREMLSGDSQMLEVIDSPGDVDDGGQEKSQDDSSGRNKAFQDALQEVEGLRQLRGPDDAVIQSSQVEETTLEVKKEYIKALVLQQCAEEASAAATVQGSAGSSNQSGLKDVSKDPVLECNPETQAAKDRLKFCRDAIISLPNSTLWVDVADLTLSKDDADSPSHQNEHVSLSIENDLTTIFSDLQLFALPEICPSEGPILDTKKKLDKNDRNGYSRRLDETTYTKLYPTNAFMHKRPTLVSALQPSKKWRKGRWADLDESPVVSDSETPVTVATEDSMSCKPYIFQICLN